MNDRYLFKAKVKANVTGHADLDWIKGNLIVEQSTGKHYICDLSHFDNDTKLCDVIIEVDPSTICQCTGLKDKAGTLIWENDIVTNEDFAGVVMFGAYDGNVQKNIGFFIEWGEGYYRQDLGYWAKKIKVIGMVVE